MITMNITCPIRELTIEDAHTFANTLAEQDDLIINLKGHGYDLSYWWNKSNQQLVVRDLGTEEIMTFEETETTLDLARPVLLSWFYLSY
jgi:hypothetical protein